MGFHRFFTSNEQIIAKLLSKLFFYNLMTFDIKYSFGSILGNSCAETPIKTNRLLKMQIIFDF